MVQVSQEDVQALRSLRTCFELGFGLAVSAESSKAWALRIGRVIEELTRSRGDATGDLLVFHEMVRCRQAIEQAARARGIEGAVREANTWALATFPDETMQQQAIHLVRECEEAAHAHGEELADVYMLATLIARRAELIAEQGGVDLEAEVRKKLAVNRRRKWERTPDGDYQHVRE